MSPSPNQPFAAPPLGRAKGAFQRHLRVLARLWPQRHRLSGPWQGPAETAFLPDAMRLQAEGPHPWARATAWALMALLACTLLGGVLGQVEVVAQAHGQLVPVQHVREVQAPTLGVVTALAVRNGQRVPAGALLIALDATDHVAERRALDEQQASTLQALRRAKALLAVLRADGPVDQPPPEHLVDPGFRADWAAHLAQAEQFAADARQRQAELAAAGALQQKAEAQVPLARQRESDFLSLARQGFIAEHAVQDREGQRLAAEHEERVQRAAHAQALAAQRRGLTVQRAHWAHARAELQERVQRLELERSAQAAQSQKLQQRSALGQLRAPVAGTVQQLAVHTVGAVLTEAQVALRIIPDDPEVEIEARLANADVAHVKPGQMARIKLDAYPFTRHGTWTAHVVHLGADAERDERRGTLTYPVTLKLQPQPGRPLPPLRSGMSLTAEIETGKRRVIEYFLSPIVQHLDESLRER